MCRLAILTARSDGYTVAADPLNAEAVHSAAEQIRRRGWSMIDVVEWKVVSDKGPHGGWKVQKRWAL